MDFLTNGPDDAGLTFALAHGAGAAMDSPFMHAMAEGLAGKALRVVRFEFPYMQRRRTGGKRSPPDASRVLQATWEQVIAELGSEALVIGGKSMGGRIASMVADGSGVAGLVCLGYPFHPPGKPEKARVTHLEKLRTPALTLQGTRDPLGSPPEVASYTLSRSIEVRWLEDGDHSFKPRVKSGHTLEQNLGQAVTWIHEFTSGLIYK